MRQITKLFLTITLLCNSFNVLSDGVVCRKGGALDGFFCINLYLML